MTNETAGAVVIADSAAAELDAKAAGLTVEVVASWLEDQIGECSISMDDLPAEMARYALTDPAEMREELVEEMDEMGWLDRHDVEPPAGAVATATIASPQRATPIVLSHEAESLTEDELASWLEDQIGDCVIGLDAVPAMMARFALTDPDELREELAERMGAEGSGQPQRPRH
jgi:hypothetical protein